MDSSMEMVTVRMSRGEVSTPWGFDIVPPGIVTHIIGGSLADRAGLQNGDRVDEIQGEQGCTFERAQQLLHFAGHEIDLVVLRDPSMATTTRIWQPTVTFESNSQRQGQNDFKPQNLSTTTSGSFTNPPTIKVSLEHQPLQSSPVPGFNTSAQPYQSELNNNQPGNKSFDLPYINRAEKYLLEKGGLFGTDPSVMKAREKPSFMQSETLKLIQEEERNSKSQRTKKPDAKNDKEPIVLQKSPDCFLCTRPIVGVMCRVNEAVVHPECFQCSTCGASLKNVGHHYINEKFYCDVHGAQRQQQQTQVHSQKSNGKPAPPILSTMDRRPLNPDLVVRTPPTAVQPTRVPEPPKGFYQPEILAPDPLSPSQPPRKPPLDSFAKTSIYNSQTYNPEAASNEEIITIGKLSQQSTSATLEARRMSRTFAPFVRSRSVRGIQWPPEPETEREQKSLEAIRYWKLTLEPGDRQKKTLQDLINEDQECSKKYVREPSSEPPKLNAKRVVQTPHRLNTPMRNPLEAYAEKIRSQGNLASNNLCRTRSAASIVSIGPPPAVNVSWSDLIKPIALKPPQPKKESPNTTFSQNENPKTDLQVNQRNELPSPEPDSVNISDNYENTNDHQNDEWQAKSEILEEKDILTDASSLRQSDGEEDTLQLPKFDERTSQFLDEQMAMNYDDSVSPSVDEMDRKSAASTIKEEDDEYVMNQAERENWNQVGNGRDNAELEFEVDEHVEKLCLDQLAQVPLPGNEVDEDFSKDRETAIQAIEQHQQSLQSQQEQLSQLLDNAIRYLKETEPLRYSDYANLPISNGHRPSLSPDVDPYSPSGKILQQLLSHDDNGLLVAYAFTVASCAFYYRKTTIYEQHRLPASPPNNGYPSSNTFTDGIRQHGTLMNSNNMIPFCEYCKQQIRGAYVLATGLTWCPEHFTCANSACNRRLLDTGFVEEKGKKYCEKCFETLIAPICSKCAMPITADCLTALQKQWHPECFVCHHCSHPFGNAAFYLENGKPYCEQDWNMLFTTKCVSCKFPIEAGDRWVEAIGSAFHSNCFSCTVCQTNLEGQSFYAKNGLPFCRIHA